MRGKKLKTRQTKRAKSRKKVVPNGKKPLHLAKPAPIETSSPAPQAP